MPVKHRVYPDQRLVHSCATGYLTAAEIREHMLVLSADPDFDESFDHLADYSGVTDWQISSNQMNGLADARLFSPSSRRALVAQDNHQYGLLRMYLGHRGSDSRHVRIFRSLKEALAWIGLPDTLPAEDKDPDDS